MALHPSRQRNSLRPKTEPASHLQLVAHVAWVSASRGRRKRGKVRAAVRFRGDERDESISVCAEGAGVQGEGLRWGEEDQAVLHGPRKTGWGANG